MESNKRPRQVMQAIQYMQIHGSISSREAFLIGIMSFPKRIQEMKEYGIILGEKWESFERDDGSKGRAKRWHIIAMPEGVTA